jgi:hypothetical protein
MSETEARDGRVDVDQRAAAPEWVAAARERVTTALRLEPGEVLERAYVFEPVERGGVAFLLALVTKRLADGRLEMAALGGRADTPGWMELEFARRARFPDEVLPSILAELIDRCDAEGAVYREVDLDLDAGTAAELQVAALVDRLLPPDVAT